MPVINPVKTGQNIMNMRKQRGMSVKDLQNLLGFATPAAIYAWQQGRYIPAIDNLVVIAAAFGCKVDDIIAIDLI